MEIIKLKFDKIKESKNPEKINDFLVRLSENPKKEYLKYLKELIGDLNTQLLDKVSLNLIFILGEIGGLTIIDEYYLNFIFETYYHSDRWIRNEILQAIDKISRKSELPENIVLLIGNALNEEYYPIKMNALKILFNLDTFPIIVFKNLLHALNSKDSEVLDGCRRIFNKIHLDIDRLFSLLYQSDNYKILKLRGIRSLLLIQFNSIIYLESFRKKIQNSQWHETFKMNYLKEIDTFQRIMAKNL
jgi:hypothetical protein